MGASEVGVSMRARSRPEWPSHEPGIATAASAEPGVTAVVVGPEGLVTAEAGTVVLSRDPLDSPRAKPETTNPAATIAVRRNDRPNARRDFLERRDMRTPLRSKSGLGLRRRSAH